MSSSKLSVICDKIIEVSWLAAMVTVPLFFSGYTSTVTEADKLALLRMIVSVMIAAWFLKWIEQSKSSSPQPALSLRAPMVLATLITVGVYLIATLTSIVPRISFFGAFNRPQGTLALLSYVVVFAMILQGLRRRAQLDRLILIIVLTSLPIALYGIVQKIDLDPLAWSDAFEGRVGATLGNPIFLSAYLIMVFPLALSKVVAGLGALVSRDRAAWSATAILDVVVYALIASVQAIAIVLSMSRGPWLGWFAGVTLFILLMALAQRRWRLVQAAVGLGLAGIAFLVVLNIPNTPLQGLREMPGLARLANLANPTGEFRLYTWENAARLVLPHAPIQFPDGTLDRLNVLRPLVGYGPDAMPLVYNQIAPSSSFSRDHGTDRSHNGTWDVLVTAGLLGLVAYQALFSSIFLYALRGLGLIVTRRERNFFIGLWIGLGLAGGLAAFLLGQPGFLGLGIPAGNIAAIILCLFFFFNRSGNEQPEPRGQFLLAALFAGLFAHYIETQFGIDVPATSLLVWTFAGILVAFQSLDAVQVHPSPQAASRQPMPSSWVGSLVGYAVVIAIILSTLLYEFVTYVQGLADPIQIFWRGLTFDPVHGATTYVVLGMLLGVWLLASALAATEIVRAEQAVTWPTSLLWVAGVSVILALGFGFGLAILLSQLKNVPIPVVRLEDVLYVADRAVGLSDYYALCLFWGILIGGVVWAFKSGSLPSVWLANKPLVLIVAPVSLAVCLLGSTLSSGPIHAGVIYRMGKLFDDNAEWNAAIALYKRAIELSPLSDPYYMALGRVFTQKANSTQNPSTARFNGQTQLQEILSLDARQISALGRVDLLYAGQVMLLRARDLNPLYTDHTLNLARFYTPELPVNTTGKWDFVNQADGYYLQASRLNPYDVLLWNEWSNFDLQYKNDRDAALAKLEKSLVMDPQFAKTYQYLGTLYADQKDFAKAIEAYQKSLALDTNLAESQSKLAFIYYSRGEFAAAAQAYLKYIELAPKAANLWEAHKNLALIYKETGDHAAAVREAQIAARLAPSEYSQQIIEWIKQLPGQ